MVDFKIHSLTFTSCGRSFDIFKYALLLESIEYAELVNCSFHDNLGTALAVYHTSITLAGNNKFTHNHCDHEGIIVSNSCVGGGGITALHSNLKITGNTTFLRNHANFGSAGIHVTNCSLSSTGSIHFINNSLAAPQTLVSISSGVAIWASGSSLDITGTTNVISNSKSAEISGKSAAQCISCGAIYAGHNTSLSFTGTSNFINNSAYEGGAIYAGHNTSLSFTGTSNFINNSAVSGGAIAAHYITSLSFTGISNFINNSAHFGGAIFIGDVTSLSFTGSGNFINNSAKYWGGGVCVSNSTFFIPSNTMVYWESNHAQFGGAFYVGDFYNPFIFCTTIATYAAKDECFFQIPSQNLSNGIDAQLVFKDNSAYAGSVLYGGAIDNCKLTDQESYTSGEVFNMLVHIETGNANSSISSYPFRVCPCENTTLTVVSHTSHTQSILVKHFMFLWLQLDREMEHFL